jgi:flagellar M-ring protein FliF
MAVTLPTLDTLSAVKGRVRSVLAQFTAGQKVVTVVATIVLVGGGVAFMRVESQPNYQPLFTNLQTSDAGAVTTQLAAAKIPYELSNGGSTILVPANLVDQERVALAEQGLPSSGTVGFSNLEKSGITTSQFVQQVEYQQALEGQLQQTIESIQGVQSAQVSLVIPAQSSFAIGNQPATTASILVDLAPGTSLSPGQVQAIVHLTAAATPGLSTSGVTVVDNHGDVLSSSGATASGTGSSNSQQTDAYDNQLASAIDALLNRVVGVGNSAVQVHALLNFNQQSTTIKGIQTNVQGQPIIAPTGQTTSSQSYSGTGSPPSGVLGAGTPTPTTPSGGTYTSRSSQVTNAVGQITQTVNQAPGQVVKTSVAVLLNSDSIGKASVARVSSLVSAAAGLNTANGDQLVVTTMPFAKPAVIRAVTGSTTALLERAGEVAGLVVLIALMLYVALRASRRTRYDEVAVTGYSPAAPKALSPEHATRPAVELPVAPIASSVGGAPDVVLAQVSSYIEQRPAEVARLLRAWANEHDTEPA